MMADAWKPPAIADRPNGYRCLAFHRGKWRDVIWVKAHGGWMTHFSSAFFLDGDRKFAPLPPLPEGHDDEFWEYKL